MEQIVLVLHLMIAIALVGVVLLQRSEGGGLGIGGGGAGGPLMSVRGAANLLTRTTAILAACFVVTSLTLAILAGGSGEGGTILDTPTEADSDQPSLPPLEQPADPLAND
ncbi:MAG: preprotein translocase subunit SecG [Rhodospirillaceae bacterium]|nr:preprotein translocase subunit SecG [Rhodospirillaceae bacterium]MCA8932092.1 preprotein translocase subunit SecG [Rhodospirillaceae bacterium]